MTAGSHVALAAAAWVWAAPALHLPVVDPVALALCCFGALLPDIDHPASWVGRRTRALSRPLSRLFGHRGITHSALAVVAAVLLARPGGLGWRHGAPLALGYVSHLGADLLTPAGLRLAWPLRASCALPLCRTGAPSEALLVLALLACTGMHLLGRV